MYDAMMILFRMIEGSITNALLTCSKWKNKLAQKYRGMRYTTKALPMTYSDTDAITRLQKASLDVDNIDYGVLYYAFKRLRDFGWQAFPTELIEAGKINVSHITIMHACERIDLLTRSVLLSTTELELHRGYFAVAVFEWLCRGKGWSEDGVIADLNAYAAKISELCRIMTFHMERGPMTTVQKNNWWVIHREVQVAVNTMAQLYMVLKKRPQ